MGKTKRGLKTAAVITGVIVLLLLIAGGMKVTLSREGAINRKKPGTEWQVKEYTDALFEFSYSDDSLNNRKITGYNTRTPYGTSWFSIELMHYRYELDENKRNPENARNYTGYMSTDKDTVKRMLMIFKDVSDTRKARWALWFVQSLNTEDCFFDIDDDIPKYALQTLYDIAGNSADKSVLMASMLNQLGFKCALLYNSSAGKMAVGIALQDGESGDHLENNGVRYGFADVCVPGREIGVCAENIYDYQIAGVVSDENSTLLYYDDRISSASYERSEDDQETIVYSMKGLFKQNNRASISFEVNRDDYAYYSSLGRYITGESFVPYINDERNRQYAGELVERLLDAYTIPGDSEWYKLCVLINFVHNISYVEDGSTDYPQYPVETLFLKKGDCEDQAVLMAAMLQEYGYECAFVYSTQNEAGHASIAVKDKYGIFSGDYCLIGGEKYYFLECVNLGWQIGQLPPGTANMIVEHIPVD